MATKNTKPKSFRAELATFMKQVMREVRADGYAASGLLIRLHNYSNCPVPSGFRLWEFWIDTEHPEVDVLMGALLPAHIRHYTFDDNPIGPWIHMTPAEKQIQKSPVDGIVRVRDIRASAWGVVCEYIAKT